MSLTSTSLAATAGAVLVALTVTGASAQTTTGRAPPSEPLSAMGGHVPEAPVGHRQPRVSDLPPDVAREESPRAESPAAKTDEAPAQPSARRRTDSIEPDLRICRGC